MNDLCLRINIKYEGEILFGNLHVHLQISEKGNIFLKFYEIHQLLDWIAGVSDYSLFANCIEILVIEGNKNIEEIIFREAKILKIVTGDNYVDKKGKFFIIELNCLSINYIKDKNLIYKNYSKVYLDNHSFDLINSLIKVDGFFTNPKVWEAINTNTNGSFFGARFILDFHEDVINDADSYPQIIYRRPRFTIDTLNINRTEFYKYIQLICSVISFYIGNEIDFIYAEYYRLGDYNEYYRNHKVKEKILMKNLGMYNIKINIYEFIKKLNSELKNEISFVSEIIKIFLVASKLEGTSKFMFLFTVIEKLRKKKFKKDEKNEKFKFKNGRSANTYIKHCLNEIKNLIIDDMQDAFDKMIDSKIINIKYLPQSSQFLELFTKYKIHPDDYGLDFKQIVDYRGDIFHGKFIEYDDASIKDINFKLSLFVANLLYNYLTYHTENIQS